MSCNNEKCCVVLNCQSSDLNSNNNVIMNEFPIGKKRRDEWLRRLGRSDLIGKSLVNFNNYVCSEHFGAESFIKSRSAKSKSRLKRNALPLELKYQVEPNQSCCDEIINQVGQSQICCEIINTKNNNNNCYQDEFTNTKDNNNFDELDKWISTELCLGIDNLTEFFNFNENTLLGECLELPIISLEDLQANFYGTNSVTEKEDEQIQILEDVVIENVRSFKATEQIEANCDTSKIPKDVFDTIEEVHEDDSSIEESDLYDENFWNCSTKLWTCQSCGLEFASNNDYKSHCLTHNESSELCYLCGKIYKGKYGLVSHLQTCRKPLSRHSCSICKKEFAQASILKHHMKTVHTDKRSYVCCICQKGFKRKDHLQLHMVKIHESESAESPTPFNIIPTPLLKMYECVLCDFKTSNITDYDSHCCTAHEKNEDGVDVSDLLNKYRNFKCSFCSKRFPTNQGRNNHQNLHLGQTVRTDRTYECLCCDEVFYRRSLLRKHEHDFHNIQRNIKYNPDMSNIKCRICHKKFHRMVNLRSHMIVHETTKEYKCSKCSKSFLKAKTLRAHEKTHSQKTICEKCGRKFSLYVAYLKHKTECKGSASKPRRYAQEKKLRQIIQCSKCNLEVLGLKMLQTHLMEAHRGRGINVQEILDSVKMIKCRHCDSRFTEEIFRNRHEERVHSAEDSRLKCLKCDRVFSCMRALQYHFDVNHPEEQ